MGFEEQRYLFGCLNTLDDYLQDNVKLANQIEGGLIVLGVLESSIKFSKKNKQDVCKVPSNVLKLTTMKNLVFKFNDYMRNVVCANETCYDSLLDKIKNTSLQIIDDKLLSKSVEEHKIKDTENIFVYIKDSLIEGKKFKKDMHLDWFIQDIPLSSNLRMGDKLERVLDFNCNELYKKRHSKSARDALLLEEYKFLVSEVWSTKKDFDLRYLLNKVM